ncbi:RadC family protein [Enterococcus bulliens]
MEQVLHMLPRERLVLCGEVQLTNAELFAIIFRSGNKQASVDEIVAALIERFPTMYALRNATLSELQSVKGIGAVRAIELKAIIELGRRIHQTAQVTFGKITSSYAIATALIEEMRDLRQEHLVCLYLTTKNEVIAKETIFIGSLNQSIAHPREIFKGAVRHSAARILLAHNHPSGDPHPSTQDDEFTKRMKKCGVLMGIELLDHIIIGDHTYFSLKEEGII